MKTIVHILILISLIVSTGLKPIQHLIDEISIDSNIDEENMEGKDMFCLSTKPYSNDVKLHPDVQKNMPLISIGMKILSPSYTGTDVLDPPELI